jgi:hypothetical protein
LDSDCKVIDLQSLDRIFDEYEQKMGERRRRKNRQQSEEENMKIKLGEEEFQNYLQTRAKLPIVHPPKPEEAVRHVFFKS